MYSRPLIFASILLLLRSGNATPSNEIIPRDSQALVFSQTMPAPTTTSSFNWWPYPSFGATTMSSSTFSAGVGFVDTTPAPPSSTPTVSSTSQAPSSSSSYIEISALPADTVNMPRPHASIKRPFNPIKLVPVFGFAGFIGGSVCTWFCFRCSSRSRRSRGSDFLEPGPPYMAAARDLEDEHRSPSKYSMHGSIYSDNKRPLTRISSYSTHRSAVLSPSSNPYPWPTLVSNSGCEDDPFLVASIIDVPVPARTTTGFLSPDPLSLLRAEELEENDEPPYESLNHKSIRAGILDKLKFGMIRKKVSQVRTRAGHTRMNSDCQLVDEDGTGLKCVREKESPVDMYTALPARGSTRTSAKSSLGMRMVDSAVLPTSPSILSSTKLNSELFFSPLSTIRQTPRKPRSGSLKDKTLPSLPSANLSTSPSSGTGVSLRPSSSFYLGSPPPKRSAADRYIARQSALNKVEEIVSKSRSDNGISLPHSPTSFGAIAEEAGNIAVRQLGTSYDVEEAGIEQRLFG